MRNAMPKTRFERWIDGDYENIWPQALYDLVELEELSPTEACYVAAYCREHDIECETHDDWLAVLNETTHKNVGKDKQ